MSSTSSVANQLIRSGLSSLDITDREQDEVESAYKAMSASFSDAWDHHSTDDAIFPQGSFLLGTVTRVSHREDQIDIDLVARRGLSKESTTREALKSDVGGVLQSYATASSGRFPTVDEDDRCWNLGFPNFHADVLPAIPNGDSSSPSGLLIPDRSLTRWVSSDPLGYRDWFVLQAAAEFEWERAIFAERKQVEVEDVPSFRVRTNLQRSVQALKRHRDVYFQNRLDDRPSSIVITTLAARAYVGGGDLTETVRSIADSLATGVRHEGGLYIIENPVETDENFAEYWTPDSKKADYFFEWAEVLQKQLGSWGRRAGLTTMVQEMGTMFGEKTAAFASASLAEESLQARDSGKLAMMAGAGTLTTSATGSTRSVPKHDFWGNGAV